MAISSKIVIRVDFVCRLCIIEDFMINKNGRFYIVDILCIESCDSHVTSSCSGLHIHTIYILIIVWLHVYVHNTHNWGPKDNYATIITMYMYSICTLYVHVHVVSPITHLKPHPLHVRKYLVFPLMTATCNGVHPNWWRPSTFTFS